jgi:hypothetical protein
MDKHFHGLPNTASQFNAKFSHREAFLSLVLEGVRQAGQGFGRVTRRTEPAGILHTECRMDEEVGTFTVLDPDAPEGVRRVATRCFDIVTERVPFKDGTSGHLILSIYPENPNKF